MDGNDVGKFKPGKFGKPGSSSMLGLIDVDGFTEISFFSKH